MDTIFVKQVKDGGPAHTAGLQKGDRIVSVNGESVTGKTYSQVIALIQASDASLRLLVVPKDEDILQMAYETSACSLGQRPYKGHASEIPAPPVVYPQGNSCSPRAGEGVRSTPPLGVTPPRFKSELHVLTEDRLHQGRPAGSSPRRYAGDSSDQRLTKQRSSTSSLTSGSSSASSHGGLPRDMGHIPESVSVSQEHGNNVDVKNSSVAPSGRHGTVVPPVIPLRTSSRNFSIQGPAQVQHKTGSVDSISKSSDGSRYSQDSHRPWQRQSSPPVGHESPRASVASDSALAQYSSQERLLRLGNEPRRSHESLRYNSDDMLGSTQQPISSSSSSAQPMPKSVTTSRLPPSSSPAVSTSSLSSSSQHVPYLRSRTTSALLKTNAAPLPPRMAATTGHWTSDSTVYVGRGARDCRDGGSPGRPLSELNSRDYQSAQHSIRPPAGRRSHSPSRGKEDNYGLRVSYKSRGENGTVSDEAGKPPLSPMSKVGDRHSVPERPMINLVTERMRKFESAESVEHQTPSERVTPVSAAPWRSKGEVGVHHRRQPKVGYDSVATRTAQFENRFTESDDEESRRRKWSVDGVSHYSTPSGSASNLSQLMAPPTTPWVEGTPPATINFYFRNESPQDEECMFLDESPEKTQDGVQPEEVQRDRSLLSPDASERDRLLLSPDKDHKPILRQPSYLTAVNSPKAGEQKVMNPDNVAANGSAVTSSSPSETQVNTDVSRVRLREKQMSAAEREAKLVRRTSYLLATRQAIGKRGEAGQTAAAVQANSQTHLSTPPKASNIRKLKSLFGERTPRIVEAIADKKSLFDMPSQAGETILEGTLSCKIAVTDGKRASDRSWKPIFAQLRGQAMYIFKDKSNVSPTSFEDQPISTKSSIVDIAYDYTKKKNVFRLTTCQGSEYLFQADDHDTMLQWIRMVQAHSSADDENEAVANQEHILRKTAQYETSSRTSPQVAPKSKKTSSRSLRSKSPSSHSPGPKPKKQYTADKDHFDSPKSKDSKTWKGRMAKKFKRYGSSSSTSAETSEASEAIDTAMFGVPLDMCFGSANNEFVPFVVDVCTKIVEEQGLDNQGIYRVPGNTGAVNMLQEELNRGGDSDVIDLSNEKWGDVNVVGSLLKSFFRKLPDPLVTDDLYDMMIMANRTENPEKRMLKIKKLLHELPDHNFETFRYLAKHLSLIADHDNMNKMDVRNLAIVFGPTLIRPCEDSMITMVRDMSDQCRIVESIISHFQWFFSSWDEDINVPIDMEDPDAMPVSGMNQQLLVKAENLELGERGRDLSAKDLVSSIFQAANRKMRKKDKTKSGDSVDVDGDSESGYNERNIDREIELRRVQQMMMVHTEPRGSTAHATSTSQSSSSSLHTAAVTQSLHTAAVTQSSHTAAVSQSSHTAAVTQSSHTAAVTQSSHTEVVKQRSSSEVVVKENSCTTLGQFSSAEVSASASRSSHVRQAETAGSAASSQTSMARPRLDRGAAQSVSPPPPPPPPASAEAATSRTLTESEEQLQKKRHHNASLLVKRYPAYQPVSLSSASTENAKPILLKKYSEEAAAAAEEEQQRGNHDEVRQTYGLTFQARQHLRKLEKETQALRQVDEEQRLEQEKHAHEKKQIELELQKTRRELEQEDSFEEIIGRPADMAAKISDLTARYSDYINTSGYDTRSLTSDYSTMSSTNLEASSNKSASPHSTAMTAVRPYTSEAPAAAVDRLTHTKHPSPSSRAQQPGNKHTKVKSSTASKSASMDVSVRAANDDMMLYRKNSQHGKAFNSRKVVGRGTLNRKREKEHTDTPSRTSFQDTSVLVPTRASGVEEHASQASFHRRGSLDSLLDNSVSYVDTDSENGESLMDSLAAVDHRFKALLSPKASSCSSSSSSSTAAVAGSVAAAYPAETSPSSKYLAKQKFILESPEKQVVDLGARSRELRGKRVNDSALLDRPFRDPSLHRAQAQGGDTKLVGIASRFERKTESFADREKSAWGSRRAGAMKPAAGTQASPVSPTAPADNGACIGSTSPTSRFPITKSEKTDTNLSRKQQRAGVSGGPNGDCAKELRERTERSLATADLLASEQQALWKQGYLKTSLAPLKPVSVSPQPRRKTVAERRRERRRRHTVGGSDDLEHFKALMSLHQLPTRAAQHKVSAWDRLQPAVNDADVKGLRDVTAWLAHQRLRHAGSSPALFDPTLTTCHSFADEEVASELTRHQPPGGTRHGLPAVSRTGSSGTSGTSHSSSPSSPASTGGTPSRGRSNKFTFESSI